MPFDFSGGAAAAGGDVTQICDSIASVTVASFDTNTILGGDIPQVYKHLLIVLAVRNDAAAANGLVYMRLNNDSGGNYDYEMVNASGTTVVASQVQGGFQMAAGRLPGGTAPANSFSCGQILIADYTSTAMSKAVIASSTTRESAAAGGLHRESDGGVWFATPAAVTRITVYSSDGTGFVANSRFTLYGLK